MKLRIGDDVLIRDDQDSQSLLARVVEIGTGGLVRVEMLVSYHPRYVRGDLVWAKQDAPGRMFGVVDSAVATDQGEIRRMMADTVDRAILEPQKSALKDRPGAWLDSLTSAERKEVAMSRGLLAYFPDALALVARHSVIANEKHNPGEPLHWSREKSSDHNDCIIRHSASIAVDPDSTDDGQPHVVCRAWRALAALQLWAEAQVAKREKA